MWVPLEVSIRRVCRSGQVARSAEAWKEAAVKTRGSVERARHYGVAAPADGRLWFCDWIALGRRSRRPGRKARRGRRRTRPSVGSTVVYTPAEREELRDSLVAAARNDPRITAAALTGSAAAGREDAWSDID